MKRTTPLLRPAIAFLAVLMVCGVAQAQTLLLTNAAQIRALSRAEARSQIPVRFRGVVTYFEFRWQSLFVQDGADGVFVASGATAHPPCRAGQVVEIEGVTDSGYFPQIINSRVRVVGEAPLPAATPITFDEFATGRDDARLVEVEGVVRSVRAEFGRLLFEILQSPGSANLIAHLPFTNGLALPTELVFARVRVRGVAGIIVNRHGRVFGMRLFVPGLEHMTALNVPPHNPLRLPDPAVNLGTNRTPAGAIDQRIRVQGVVTLIWPSGTMFIRQVVTPVRLRLGGAQQLADPTGQLFPIYKRPEIKVGDYVEALGFPVVREFSPMIEDATVNVLGVTNVPAPLSLTATQAVSADYDAELMQITGRVVDVVPRESAVLTERRLLIEAEDRVFEARLEAPAGTVIGVKPGAMVRLTGVASVILNDFRAPVDFRLLLRSPADIHVLRDAPRWLRGDILRVAGISGAALLAVLGWAVALRKRVLEQKARIVALHREAELQERIQQTQQLLSSITQNISDGIYRSTPGKGLVYVNEAFVKMFGYASTQEMLEVPSAQLYADPEARARLISLIERHGKFVNEEVEFVRKDGSRFWGLASSIGIKDDSGQPLYFDGAITDVTERKRMQDELQRMNLELERRIVERTQELRETEARFSKAFHASPAFMSIARLSDGQFIEVNDAFLEVTGWSREEVIGSTSLDLGLWSHIEERNALMKDLRERGYVRNRESHMRVRSGERMVVLLSAELLHIGDQPHILAVSIDITARKRAEAELRRALDSEKELSQLKSNFVSMVSHEFRTPLGIINSSSQILQRYFERLSPEERLDHLQSIAKSVKRMSSLMEEVLVLSKVEAGQVVCQASPIDLPALLERLTNEVQSATNNRCPIELVLGELPPAMGDEKLLRHIFTNLLSNAVKFSPAGKGVRFSVQQEGATAVFAIRDQGIGIPVADQPNLFRAFQRGSNAANIQGTGLGLTIVKRCVELHGGDITFQTREGAGTTFEVGLPLFENVTEGQ
jgi:PAS domain S-box-containing protein